MTTLPALLLLLLPFASPQVEVEGLLSAHGYGKPKPDAALDRVASVLAERLSGATSATPPTESADLLSHLLARAQISDAQVLPYTLRHSALGEFTTQLPLFVARLDRRMNFDLAISDRTIYLTLGDETLTGTVEARQIVA